MPNIEELERCASNRQVRLNEAEAVELDPFITSEVPSGVDGASQPGNATVQLVRLGAVADVVNLVIDDEAIDDANMLASASYVVVLCDGDIAKLSSAMLSFFGFDLLDEDQRLIVDRTFEVPAIDLWMECGVAGAYLAAWFEYEQHTVDWQTFEPRLSLFFQAFAPLNHRLVELRGFKDHEDHRMRFNWRCILLSARRCLFKLLIMSLPPMYNVLRADRQVSPGSGWLGIQSDMSGQAGTGGDG